MIENPKQAMAGHAFIHSQCPQSPVAREQRSAVAHSKGQRKCVGQRQGRYFAPVGPCSFDLVSGQVSDDKTQFKQLRTAVVPQFPLVKQIRYDEAKRQPKGLGKQFTTFEVHENRRVGYEQIHGYGSRHAGCWHLKPVHTVSQFVDRDREQLRRT